MADDQTVEVERKFVLMDHFDMDKLPDYVEVRVSTHITQAYLITEPGELRIRKMGNDTFITVKGDGDISRDEWEMPIPAWVFDQLLLSSNLVVKKVRLTLADDNDVFEVDIFEGDLAGLEMVEIEWLGPKELRLELEARARSFELPSFLGAVIEVTDDKRFKNKNLAQSGAPRLY